MPTAMPTQFAANDIAEKPRNALRPVFLTVLSLKLAVAGLLLLSVSLSPPLSAESRYLAGDHQMAGAN